MPTISTAARCGLTRRLDTQHTAILIKGQSSCITCSEGAADSRGVVLNEDVLDGVATSRGVAGVTGSLSRGVTNL
jgi:hypothetical protein